MTQYRNEGAVLPAELENHADVGSTVWLTKYCLAPAGIEEAVVNYVFAGGYRTVQICHLGRDSNWYSGYVPWNEWHNSREDAVIRAEQKRVARIAALRKEIAELEALRFE